MVHQEEELAQPDPTTTTMSTTQRADYLVLLLLEDTEDEEDNYVLDRVAESGDLMHYLGSWKSLLYAAAAVSAL